MRRDNNAAGFVGYGSAGGVRAVALLLHGDFENYTVFKPGPRHGKAVQTLLDQVLAWGDAFKALRSGNLAAATAR